MLPLGYASLTPAKRLKFKSSPRKQKSTIHGYEVLRHALRLLRISAAVRP